MKEHPHTCLRVMEKRVSPRRRVSPALSSSSSSEFTTPMHVGVLTGGGTPVNDSVIDMGGSSQMPAAVVEKEVPHHHHHHEHHHGYLKLAFCAAGIYSFFLSWGLLQERIATIGYLNWQTGTSDQFKSFILLNWVQALISAVMAASVLLWRRYRHHHHHSSLATFLFGSLDPALWWEYGKVSLSGSLASPFGYAALRYINYPTMVLGKSCKLVPVLLLNVLLYRRRFEPYKYLTVAMITVGVSLFMFGEGKSHHANQVESGVWGSLWGLFLLLINLMLDGATNSIQDNIFHRWHVSSLQMMLSMSCLMTVFMSGYLLITAPFGGDLPAGLAFVSSHPSALPDLLAFGACGGLGQLFIFYTISHFGSLSLVTITVTRKLFTILLSLFWFNHRLRPLQWFSVSLIFVALMIESYGKRLPHKTK